MSRGALGASMALRTAGLDDAPSIASVHVRSWRETYRGILPASELAALDVAEETRFWERMLERQGEQATTLVAEADGGIVGFAAGGPARDDGTADEGEVYAVYLLERHQGQGLGRQLFAGVLEHLRSHGLTPVGLWVLAANPTVGFYEHLGGRRVGEREEEHGLTEVRYRWSGEETQLNPSA